jgi:hypothetical protein
MVVGVFWPSNATPNCDALPLVEERKAYSVGFGPPDAPLAAWQCDAPALQLSSAEHASLVSAHGSGPLWVRQVGTFDRSAPLLLADLA